VDPQVRTEACDEKTELLRAVQQALRVYSHIVNELSRATGDVELKDFEALRLQSLTSQDILTKAFIKYKNHVQKHQC
jgi:hypothetical protein